ncbi:MAG: hypothetical protein ACI8RZ_003958 [Myxococcota bacterium]|jgi:hypothetical protein
MFALLVPGLLFAQQMPILPAIYEVPREHMFEEDIRERRLQHTSLMGVSGAMIAGGVVLAVGACPGESNLKYSSGGCSLGRSIGGTFLVGMGGGGVLIAGIQHGVYSLKTAAKIPGSRATLGKAGLLMAGASIVSLYAAVEADEMRIVYAVSAPLLTSGIVFSYLQTAENIRTLSGQTPVEVSLLPVLSPDRQGAQLQIQW